MKHKGFTLIEGMVVIAIIAMLLAAIFPLVSGIHYSNPNATSLAEQEWAAWLDRNYAGSGYRVIRSECVSQPRWDGGFIPCTATLTNSKGDILRENMECATGGNYRGCTQPIIRYKSP